MARIGRRAFIGSSAAVALAHPARANATATLRVERHGDRIVVLAGAEERWRIDPAALGCTRPAVVEPGVDGPLTTPFTVSLTDVALPGGLRGGVSFAIMQEKGGWQVQATWRGLPGGGNRVSNAVRLEAPAKVALCVRLDGANLRETLHATAGDALTPAKAAWLEIDAASTVALRALSGQFGAVAGRVAMTWLRLAPRAVGAPGWRCDGAVVARTVRVGGTDAGARVDLALGTDARVTVATDAPLRIEGVRLLLVQGGPGAPVTLACRGAAVTATADGHVFGLDMSAGHLATRHATLVLAPHEGSEIKTRGTRVVRFEVRQSLATLTLAVPGTDWSRFDFKDRRITLGLRGLDAADVLLDEPGRALTLPMQDATLSVGRARDLMWLSFRFCRMSLRLGDGPARLEADALVPQGITQGDATALVPGPVLVAEFPPQHVMEQAFPRQMRELPDAGQSLSPQDLSLLRKGGPAAMTRRPLLYQEKFNAETDDGTKKQFEAYAKTYFAKWNTQWVGPEGLFSAIERQQARLTNAELASDAARTIRNSLDNTANGPADARTLLLIDPQDVVTDTALRDALAVTPETDGVKRLGIAMREARNDRMVDQVQSTWEQWAGRPQGAVLFVLPDWPFRPAQRQFVDQNGTVLDAGVVKAFLRQLLDDLIGEIAETAKIDLPVVARSAGPSRLAFSIPYGAVIPLTADHLTRWDDYELSVIQRARRLHSLSAPDEAESNLAAILASQGIGTHGSGQDRMKSIRDGLKAPGEWETALEVPTRLFLSPAQDVRWHTPGQAGRPGWSPLWQARLVETGSQAPSLRAVWSSDFVADVFAISRTRPPHSRTPLPQPGVYPGMQGAKAALDSADRHDFVAMSSIYGLPVVPTRGAQARPELYAFDQERADNPHAIYNPVALNTRLLTLGALGATLDHDTTFFPITAWPGENGPLFESSSLERWRSLIVDGRDVVTTVVRRGYLFPLGHRASLIKITQPRIRAIDPGSPEKGYTVVQTTRLYIEVTRATQVYAAAGQPNLGRGFPARKVKLLTLRSPDLLDPFEDSPGLDAAASDTLGTGARGRVRGCVMRRTGSGQTKQRIAGRVFWPRTARGPGGTVQWRMQIDDGATPVTFPLLFVDHAAASDPETMEALCTRYYVDPKAGGPPDWRRMQHGGAERGYADERRKGDSTFATDWQMLGVQGRDGGFVFDGPLQSAGQPPFYPTLATAQIRPQQLQGLTGKASPAVVVTFADNYVNQGFQGDGAGLNFLRLVEPYRFDMGANGDRSGGVARPSTDIRFFNRDLGPTGDVPAVAPAVTAGPQQKAADGASPPGPATATASALTVPPASSAMDFLSNFFSPDAKLLGLIPFRDIVAELAKSGLSETDIQKAMPKLTEVVQFGQQGVADVATALLPAVDATLAAIGPLDNGGGAAGKNPIHDLHEGLNSLKAALAAIPGATDEGLVAAATDAWAAGQRVQKAADAIAQAPIALIGAFAAGELGQTIQALRELTATTGLGTALEAALADAMTQWSRQAGTIQLWLAAPALPRSGLVPPTEAQVVMNAIAKAAPNAPWFGNDPLGFIAEMVRNDPDVKQIWQGRVDELTREALQTPLFAAFQTVVARAKDLKGKAFADAVSGVIQLVAALGRLVPVNAVAATCDRGAALLHATIDALAPQLERSDARFPASTTVLALVSARANLEACIRELDRLSSPLPPGAVELRATVVAWKDRLADFLSGSDAFVDQLGALRQQLLDAFPPTCSALDGRSMNALATLRLLPRRFLSVTAGLPRPPSVGAVLAALEGKVARAAADTLRATLLRVAEATLLRLDQADALPQPVAAALANLPAAVADGAAIRAGFQALRTKLDPLVAALAAAPTLQALDTAAGALDKTLRTLDDTLADATTAVLEPAALAGAASVLNASQPFMATLAKGGAAVSTEVVGVYNQLVRARSTAYSTLTTSKVGELATQLYGPAPGGRGWASYLLIEPLGDHASVDDDRLTNERDRIGAGKIVDVLLDWQHSAVTNLFERIRRFGTTAGALRLLDLDSLRTRLTDELRKLVAIRKRLRQSLDLPMAPLNLSIVKFTPDAKVEPGKPPPKGLTLESTVDLALQLEGGSAIATFSGRLEPFKLVALDVLQIHFAKGVTYKGGTNQSASLEAPIGPTNISFGDKLSFLAEIAQSFQIGGDQGPYARVRTDRPAIEAGFRLFVESLTLGITFTNIDIRAALMLPFDNQAATLSASFGQLEKPVMISAGIYGGSCFLGFEATAKGIVRFEASFEFGGVAALGYGPLSGVAYVTTGAYIRKEEKQGAEFSALFSAGFSAHIAFFSISASFVLRLGKSAGSSSISGIAILTFTFKVGFASYGYSVSVHRGMSAGFGGGGSSAAELLPPGSGILLASNDGMFPLPPFLPQRAQLVSVGYDAETDWPAYDAQFDADFRPHAGAVR